MMKNLQIQTNVVFLDISKHVIKNLKNFFQDQVSDSFFIIFRS